MKPDEYVAVALIVLVVCGASFLAARWYVLDRLEAACAVVPAANLTSVEQIAAATGCSTIQKLREALS